MVISIYRNVFVCVCVCVCVVCVCVCVCVWGGGGGLRVIVFDSSSKCNVFSNGSKILAVGFNIDGMCPLLLATK